MLSVILDLINSQIFLYFNISYLIKVYEKNIEKFYIT